MDAGASWPLGGGEEEEEDAPMGIDQATFVSLMIDKAVSDSSAAASALRFAGCPVAR